VTALENGPSEGALYVAGTGRRTAVKEVAELVRAEVWRETGTNAPIEHLPMRSGETPGSEVLADPSHLVPGVERNTLTTLEDGLHETVVYYRKMFAK
jgi:nucleoside-diphosphate-sugar epimerase